MTGYAVFDNINQTTIRYAEYTYDNAGNTTQRTITDNGIPSTTSYTYYDDNRIHTVTLPSSEVITFTYFADGSRATKETGTEWITYHYATGLVKEVHHLASDHNTTTFTLHYEPGRIIYEPYGGTPTTYYTVTDTQGTIYKLLDTSGTTVANYTYDPFGNRLTNSAPTIYNPIGFAGTYLDTETNLLYASSRYLDPTTSRFTTKDSYRGDLQSHISQNRYIYCHQNPISYSDPSGFAPIEGDNSNSTPTETTKTKTNHKEDPNPPKQGEIKPNDAIDDIAKYFAGMGNGNSKKDLKDKVKKAIDKAIERALDGILDKSMLNRISGKLSVQGYDMNMIVDSVGKMVLEAYEKQKSKIPDDVLYQISAAEWRKNHSSTASSIDLARAYQKYKEKGDKIDLWLMFEYDYDAVDEFLEEMEDIVETVKENLEGVIWRDPKGVESGDDINKGSLKRNLVTAYKLKGQAPTFLDSGGYAYGERAVNSPLWDPDPNKWTYWNSWNYSLSGDDYNWNYVNFTGKPLTMGIYEADYRSILTLTLIHDSCDPGGINNVHLSSYLEYSVGKVTLSKDENGDPYAPPGWDKNRLGKFGESNMTWSSNNWGWNTELWVEGKDEVHNIELDLHYGDNFDSYKCQWVKFFQKPSSLYPPFKTPVKPKP